MNERSQLREFVSAMDALSSFQSELASREIFNAASLMIDWEYISEWAEGLLELKEEKKDA